MLAPTPSAPSQRNTGSSVMPLDDACPIDVGPCVHCGFAVPEGRPFGDYCCPGCREVHKLLNDEGLTAYYDLRGDRGQPVTAGDARDRKWLDLMLAQASKPGMHRFSLDVQGLHCAGCVWLFEELFRRMPGGASVLVNPTLGTIDITADQAFDLRAYLDRLESFGYRFGPPERDRRPAGRDLITRMGVCIALAMNAMILSISLYAGLESGLLYTVFHWVSLGLATTSVLVGGTVFFRAAWQGLKHRVLHFDLPISIGILAAYFGSLYSLIWQNGVGSYLDTLSIFIALMLVGRFLRDRVVEQSRARLLDTTGVEGLLVSLVRNERIEIVPVTQIEEGAEILARPGDVVPVDAELLDESARLSLEWIKGESDPHEYARGETVVAGACVAGAAGKAVRLRAMQDFDASALLTLLRAPASDERQGGAAARFWSRAAGLYVVVVVSAAILGFAIWAFWMGDPVTGLSVAIAALVATCPCAFGIATPLAYEIVQAELRRQGLFVRSASFLDRALDVDRVVFDKTGTLTTGQLRIGDQTALLELAEAEQQVLYNLAARSAHPKSQAVKSALERAEASVRFDPNLVAIEEPGRGLSAVVDGSTYELGAARSSDGNAIGDLAFIVDGDVRFAVTTEEEPRHDARAEVQALRADGYDTWILSGDERSRVHDLARRCNVETSQAIGEQSPEDKAQWLREHGPERTLFLGDGINDLLAAGEAHCAGTPAADRAFLASRSDFFLVTAGLGPVRRALRASAVLRRVVRRNLVFAGVYNGAAVALAYAGLMSPLLCAVLMPISSIAITLATTVALTRKNASWKC